MTLTKHVLDAHIGGIGRFPDSTYVSRLFIANAILSTGRHLADMCEETLSSYDLDRLGKAMDEGHGVYGFPFGWKTERLSKKIRRRHGVSLGIATASPIMLAQSFMRAREQALYCIFDSACAVGGKNYREGLPLEETIAFGDALLAQLSIREHTYEVLRSAEEAILSPEGRRIAAEYRRIFKPVGWAFDGERPRPIREKDWKPKLLKLRDDLRDHVTGTIRDLYPSLPERGFLSPNKIV